MLISDNQTISCWLRMAESSFKFCDVISEKDVVVLPDISDSVRAILLEFSALSKRTVFHAHFTLHLRDKEPQMLDDMVQVYQAAKSDYQQFIDKYVEGKIL